MKNRGTAGVLIRSADIRQLVAAALQQLAFEPVSLTHATASTGCELILVDESFAEAISRGAGRRRSLHQQSQPVVLVCDKDCAKSAVADFNIDGILRVPMPAEEMALRLKDILQVHRSQARRSLPLLEELSTTRGVMQSVNSGICISDATLPHLPIVYLNPAFERMTGYTFNEVGGKNCRFLQGKDTKQPGLAAVRAAIREERDTMSVLRNFKKDGTPFWNELYLSPLRNEDGRVTHFVGIQNDVTRRVESEQRLGFLAHHDALTGLVTRGLFMERLHQATLRTTRMRTCTAVLFLDLNKFKHVNDFYGHDAGDTLLRTVAGRLVQAVRESDTVARLGGDEFVILLPDMAANVAPEQAIPALIQRLVAQVAEPVVICNEVFHPSTSVGWSLCPRDGHDPEHLLKIADTAMYAHKQAGEQAAREEEAALLPGY